MPSVRSAPAIAGLLLLVGAGCGTLPTFHDGLPRKAVVRGNGWEIRSDVKLNKDSGVRTELDALRRRVEQTLRLPPSEREVVVYLFRDEDRYRETMAERYPDLPARRAFFIGTPGELAVYAFYGDRVGEDLRHECTHGLLNAALGEVPLWLDEGLAEFFEVDPSDPRLVNTEHAQRLARSLADGWRPDLRRLEQLDTVSEMQRADYQESWAWVHWLMSTPEGRDVLDQTLQSQRSPQPQRLSEVLARSIPAAEARLTSHIAGLVSLPAIREPAAVLRY